MDKCPACGSTDRHNEPHQVALLSLAGGDKLRFDLSDSTTNAVVCTATVCDNCGFVALHEVK